MRKLFFIFSFFILVYFSYGFYLATFDVEIFQVGTKPTDHSQYHDYKGVSHIITSHSKGSASPSSILLQASQAEIDFLFFTDLNLLDRPYNLSGYHGDVFTFSNQKISYLDSHILLYTKNPDFYFDSMTAAIAQLNQHFESDTDEKNFIAVLAHPFKRNHSWSGEYPRGLNGIEVINLRHIWQDVWFKERALFIWSVLTYPFNPELSLLKLIRNPEKELALWDFLNKRSKTLGFLGNQTTAKIFKFFGINFTFPSYEKSFRFASNHILLASELTGQVTSDREKIFKAIESGNFYFAFDSLADPKGFAAYLQDNNKSYLMGESLQLSKRTKLIVDLPKRLAAPVQVQVFKDGELHFQGNDTHTDLNINRPGVYRVVIRVRPKLPLPEDNTWISWIYTNPFYIK